MLQDIRQRHAGPLDDILCVAYVMLSETMMSVRLHAILMVTSMFVVAGLFGLLWPQIGGGVAGFWYALGFVFVEVVCEEFFTRFIPIRCSNCGGRAKCRFVSRLMDHGQDFSEEPRTVITYQCDDCHRSLSPFPPIRSILGLFVGSFVGVAVFVMVILFAIDSMRTAGEFVADSGLADMIQGILLLAAFHICTISGMVIGSQIGGPATLKKEFDWVAGRGLERLVSFVLLTLGTVFFVLGPVILIGNLRLVRDGVRAVGVVTTTEIQHDQQEDRDYISATVQFRVGGKNIELTDGGSDLSVGDTVPVIYLPDDPDSAQFDNVTVLYITPIAFTAGGVMCLVIGWILFSKSRRPAWSRRKPKN